MRWTEEVLPEAVDAGDWWMGDWRSGDDDDASAVVVASPEGWVSSVS